VNPVINGMATAADWMSAASFISMAGLIAFVGYNNSLFLMGWTGGYVLMAMLLAPYLRKFGKFTVPEFIGDRYYSNTARVVAVVCLIVISVTYVIGQMTGAGVAFSRFLEVDSTTGLYIAWRSCSRLRGARRHEGHHLHAGGAVLRADRGLHHPGDLHLAAADRQPDPGSGPVLEHAGRRRVASRRVFRCGDARRVLTDLGFNEYTATTNPWLMALYTLSLMIGTAGLPHVIIRFFTVPKVADARWSAGWALVFIALLYLTAPAVGAWRA
jgi:cation/acetate symporter